MIVLDGKELAAAVRREVAAQVESFRARHGRAPALHVILAGEDPASAVYVRNKERAAREVGMDGTVHRLPNTVSEGELVALIERLCGDPTVDGLLVQLPLPKGLDEQRILDLVDPRKDVDGFHPINAGLLASGRPGLVPCTPLGCMRMIDEASRQLGLDLAGARAVVVGRSNIVGKPVAQLLLARHATVTVAHSRTRDLPAVCREADVLVVAVGRPEMIDDRHVRQGAVVIDVGINRIDLGEGRSKLVGDVHYERASARAAAITPVPGGVGPMTIAYLLQNTVRAAEARLAAT